MIDLKKEIENKTPEFMLNAYRHLKFIMGFASPDFSPGYKQKRLKAL